MAQYRIVPQKDTFAVEVIQPGSAAIIGYTCKTEEEAQAWIAKQKHMEAANKDFWRDKR